MVIRGGHDATNRLDLYDYNCFYFNELHDLLIVCVDPGLYNGELMCESVPPATSLAVGLESVLYRLSLSLHTGNVSISSLRVCPT